MGLKRWTRVCTMAWFVAFICAFSGNEHSPLQQFAEYPSGAIIQSQARKTHMSKFDITPPIKDLLYPCLLITCQPSCLKLTQRVLFWHTRLLCITSKPAPAKNRMNVDLLFGCSSYRSASKHVTYTTYRSGQSTHCIVLILTNERIGIFIVRNTVLEVLPRRLLLFAFVGRS